MLRALVVALCLAFVAVPVAGCRSVQDPKTVAEARPELVVAYEAGMRAFVWLDARNAALYEARAALVREAIKAQEPDFIAECGESAPQCMLGVYDQLMAAWEKESGYDVRTRRLELARAGLAAMRDVLTTDPHGELIEWAPAILQTAGALSSLCDELKAAGVAVPDIVADGLAAIKRLT